MADRSESTSLGASQNAFDAFRAEQHKIQLSNAENFDKAVLTLSTAALGFSMGFVKDIVHLDEAAFVILLKFSWALFCLAIISTTLSYFFAHAAVRRALEIADSFYVQGKTDAIYEENKPRILVDRINALSGFLFVLGVLVTTCFIMLNVD